MAKSNLSLLTPLESEWSWCHRQKGERFPIGSQILLQPCQSSVEPVHQPFYPGQNLKRSKNSETNILEPLFLIFQVCNETGIINETLREATIREKKRFFCEITS